MLKHMGGRDASSLNFKSYLNQALKLLFAVNLTCLYTGIEIMRQSLIFIFFYAG